jgi:hypothetical protein
MMPAVRCLRLKPVLIVMPVLLLTVGCSSSKSSSPTTTGGSTPTPASTSIPPVGSGPTTVASTADTRPTPGSTPDTFVASVTAGSGPGNITDATAGLADLASYTATLTISFDGTNAAKPSKWTTTSVMLAAKEPAARQLTVATSGDVPNPTTLFRAETNGATFEKRGEESCVADVIGADPEAAPLLGPAASLAAVIGADSAGSENVNGTPADHFTFDERAILETGRSTSKGEAWVATSGGYVVKYLLTSKAGPEFFGDGIEGTISYDYELTAVNQPVTMSLPDDCPPGLVGAPQLPDAANVDSQPGLLSYDTATAPADVVTFYQTELATAGWTSSDDATIDDTSATIEFTQGSATLVLTAVVDGATTSVQLLMT